MTWSIVLGLGTALSWGTADFMGGMQSRRLPALTVTLWSQLIAGLLLALTLLAIPTLGGPPSLRGFGWCVAAGFCGGTALLLFYRGLSVGVMSIVAPISACGALVPVAVSAVSGEQLALLNWLGVILAIGGIVLVSLQPHNPAHTARHPYQAVVLALGAALGFGLFFVCLDRAAATPDAAPLWLNVWTRGGSLPLLIVLHLSTTRSLGWPGRATGAVSLVGILDLTANVLFTFATRLGNLAVVSVLSSLYPVTTVVLGRFILAERLNGPQYLGVVLALAGVVLLAAG